MVKRFLMLLILVGFALMILPLLREIRPATELSPLAQKYVQDGPTELGAANLVTAVVVTYRGLDTLGEVAVLFIATAGIGFLLRRKEKKLGFSPKRPASEILQTGTDFLIPLIFLFGVYIFAHGHLTPGGGFQGGVIIASGILLLFLANSATRLNHTVLHFVESLSGAFYVGLGILGMILAAGFLDNRFLPLGKLGTLFSAGAIPIIYSLIGLKVGSELVGILENLRRDDI